MSTYILRYALWTILLFILVYFKGFSPLEYANELQTELTLFLTSQGITYFTMPIRMEGNALIFDHGLRLFIVNDCNGLAPILLFWAAVLAFPTSLKQKLRWLFVGYIVLMLFNTVRILAIAYGVSLDEMSFGWSHDIVGRYSMGILALTLYWVFTLRVEVSRYKSGLFRSHNVSG